MCACKVIKLSVQVVEFHLKKQQNFQRNGQKPSLYMSSVIDARAWQQIDDSKSISSNKETRRKCSKHFSSSFPLLTWKPKNLLLIELVRAEFGHELRTLLEKEINNARTLAVHTNSQRALSKIIIICFYAHVSPLSRGVLFHNTTPLNSYCAWEFFSS